MRGNDRAADNCRRSASQATPCWWGCEIITVGAENCERAPCSRGGSLCSLENPPGSALACLLPLTPGGGRYALQTFPSHCFAPDAAGRCCVASTMALLSPRQELPQKPQPSWNSHVLCTRTRTCIEPWRRRCCRRKRAPIPRRLNAALDEWPRHYAARGRLPGQETSSRRRSPRSSDAVSLTRSVNPRSAVRRSSRNKLPRTSPAWKSTMQFRGLRDKGCPRPSWRP